MLADLEQKLSSLSHSEQGIYEVQRFCDGLGDTQHRMKVWNSTNAIVRSPIQQEVACSLGFNTPDDAFLLLQGDVIRTDSAYYFGERITGSPKYAILNSSCDLVPQRKLCAALLRVIEVKRDDEQAKAKLSQLLKFSRRDSMYIPPLPDDLKDVIGNVIEFDGMCQIRMGELFLANRVASLSLVGWRIFASFSRVVVARANPREIGIRTAIEKRSYPAL